MSVAVNNFGYMPIANNFFSEVAEDSYRYPLTTSFCQTCSLFQIDEQPLPEQMFNDRYPFFTGLSSHMKSHFRDFVDDHLSHADNEEDDLFVVEVGSNDGTLLEFVNSKGIRHLGIDPSSNVVERARNRGLRVEEGFFSENLATDIVKRHGQAHFIFAANVVCHIPNLIDFGRGIKNLLSRNGRFIFEEPYVGSMIENTSYDQIYDEHVYIFGATSIRNIFSMVGLELVDVIPQDTHGGSMRYVLMHNGAGITSTRLHELLTKEESQGLNLVSTYLDFAKRCEENRIALKGLLKQLKKEGSTIAGYAATSKSTTVLNFCEIGPDLIDYIADSTIEKQGRYTPGTHIPIKSPEFLRLNAPHFLVLFAWNHEREILDKEEQLTNNGVKWIRFVPRVEIFK